VCCVEADILKKLMMQVFEKERIIKHNLMFNEIIIVFRVNHFVLQCSLVKGRHTIRNSSYVEDTRKRLFSIKVLTEFSIYPLSITHLLAIFYIGFLNYLLLAFLLYIMFAMFILELVGIFFFAAMKVSREHIKHSIPVHYSD